MSIFLAGIVHYRNHNSEAGLIRKKLLDLAFPVIGKDIGQINTLFSKIVFGRRKDASSYYDLIQIDHRNELLVGFVSGNLYSKNKTEQGFEQIHFLDPSLLKKILETKGKFLTENFWGQYLFLCNDLLKNKVYIFPEPMGFSSLFYARKQEGFVFSSDLWCVRELLDNETTLDDNFLSSQMSNMGGLITSKKTPFVEINELVHGNGLVIGEYKAEILPIWNPCEFIKENVLNKDNILETFFNVVKSQLKTNHNNALFLSGGSDSSALLMTLNHLKSDSNIINAINLKDSLISSSDESREAKFVADICNTNLTYYEWEQPFSFESNVEKSKLFDKPHVSLLNRKSIIEQENIILKYGTKVFWSGHGGDQIFCERPLPLTSIADCWIDKKFSLIIRKILDVCCLQRVSLFELLTKNLSALLNFSLKKHQEYELFNFKKAEWFISSLDDFSYKEEAFYPYFYEDLKSCSPAKAEHIVAIYEGVNQSKISEKLNRIPHIYPYYSQPLVEVALTMPVYESYNRHYTRLPFREAIQRFFKNDIVFRSAKGETSAVLQKGFRQNTKKIKELCLDGYCAKKGMIDKSIVEKHLKRVEHGMVEDLHYLINLLCIEVWCYDWKILR